MTIQTVTSIKHVDDHQNSEKKPVFTLSKKVGQELGYLNGCMNPTGQEEIQCTPEPNYKVEKFNSHKYMD